MLPLALLHEACFFSDVLICIFVIQHPINDSFNTGMHPVEVLCVSSRLLLLP